MKRLLTIIGLCVPTTGLAISINSYGWTCAGFLHCGSNQDAVEIIATNIATGIIFTIAGLAVIAFLYGAIRMAASQGGEGKEAGKKAIIWASVGLSFAILAGGIVSYIKDLIYLAAS